MSEATRLFPKSEIEAQDADPSLAAPSRRDRAIYIVEMSLQLARMADKAVLPDVIGYSLRMAARISQEEAGEMDARELGFGHSIR